MAGLDDYQFYSKFQSQESPFWETPTRRRLPYEEGNRPERDEFGYSRLDETERFDLYDVQPPGLDDEVGPNSGPFSSIFSTMPTDFDVRSGRDAWQALFGPPTKRDTVADRETEATISWATKSYTWWMNGVTLFSEFVVTHPLLVIRRQCQINAETRKCHLFPVSTIGVVYRLAKAQGIMAFYKGFTSVLLVKGVTVWSEDFLNRVTPWPGSFPKHFSLVEVCGHLAVKCGGLIAAAPFQAASLVETVQSDIASECPGFLDVFREGGYRLMCWTCPQSGRLLPIWAIIPITVLEGITRYATTEILYRVIKFGYKVLCPHPQFLEKKPSVSLKPGAKSPEHPGPVAKVAVEESITEAEKISWATKDLYNDSIFRVWAMACAHLVTYPLETVLNRLLLQGTRTIIDDLDSNGTSVLAILSGYNGFRDCVRTIAVEEGWRGFYKGAGTLFWTYLAHFALLRVADVVLLKWLGSEASTVVTPVQPNPGVQVPVTPTRSVQAQPFP